MKLFLGLMSALFSTSANKEKIQNDVKKKRKSKRRRKRRKGRKSWNLMVLDEAKTKWKFVQGDNCNRNNFEFPFLQIINKY